MEELVLIAKELNPIDFIEVVKKEKKGFVTQKERRILNDFVAISLLNDSTINILIHYILIVRDIPVIPVKLLNKISYDWVKEGIETPEKALERIEEKRRLMEKRYFEKQSRKGMNFENGNFDLKKETFEGEAYIETILSLKEWEELKKMLPEAHFQKELSYQDYLTNKKSLVKYRLSEEITKEDKKLINTILKGDS